jgi:putative peptide maturation dehydrogenase
MKIRRCAVLWLEPREIAHFELDALFAGGTGVVSAMQWFAHAPQLPAPVELDEHVAQCLGTLGPTDWIDPASWPVAPDMLAALLAHGLVVADDAAHATRRDEDESYREQRWHGLASVWHAASRWSGLDAAGEVAEAGVNTSAGLREAHGVPPPSLHDRGDPAQRIPLARARRTDLDALLDARTTCRNFDTTRALPQAQFAQLLERTFGVRGEVQAAEDFDVLKKTSPSGGALHPTEAYLVVQRVEGLAPGLYHYRAGDHELQPLPPVEDVAHFAWVAVAGQRWFADAHVLVVLAPRFGRNFWKYRNHAKAYRVTILDVGHLSQTLLLSATELGLGAFVTAAINEADIEQAFGLTHYIDGPLAVCGFGIRADAMTTSEFDPNGKVWPRSPPAE